MLSNLTTHDLKPLEAESSEILAFIPGSADEQTKQGMLLRWSDTADSSSYTVQIGPVDQPPETLAIAISSRHYIVKKNVLDRYRGKTVKVIIPPAIYPELRFSLRLLISNELFSSGNQGPVGTGHRSLRIGLRTNGVADSCED